MSSVAVLVALVGVAKIRMGVDLHDAEAFSPASR